MAVDPTDKAPTAAAGDTSLSLARTAARTADAMKADHTTLLAVGDVLSIAEYFVICSASNRRLVRAVVDEIEAKVREAHDRSPLRVEGAAEQQWVLIDYGDVVVHVFVEDVRAYYEIERLYRDVPRLEWASEGEPPSA
jgi:ribosome-associated protein